ncbi:MAG: serine hydrolase domain-containing protein [Rhodococcus sp. (in: high G+C Gram-positive bacteria)]
MSIVGLLMAGAVGLGIWARTAQTAAADAPTATESELTQRLQSLVDAGYPAALASVTSPDGTHVDVAAGTGDLDTNTPAAADGEARIGSNTKMFVAVIVMQLVEEGSAELDAPVETYLPGIIRGDGIDGAAITVRQLLQHTSGLPEYADGVAADAFGVQNMFISPRDMLDVALTQPAVFAPGERWEYSNTNYLTLGLLVERVTERPLFEQVHDRIVEPLGLTHTYMPAPGERTLRGDHPNGYHLTSDGDLRDITSMDPSFAWSAGSIVATPSDLNRFMQALLGETLVDATSLAQIKDTVPAGDELWPDARYGLGLQSYPLSCGGTAWGHGGDIPGTQTRNAVGPDGTAVTIVVTALPWAIVDPADEANLLGYYKLVVDTLDETLCEN